VGKRIVGFIKLKGLGIDFGLESENKIRGLKKIKDAFGSMKFYDHFTRIVFFAGLVSLLIFAGINFFN
jgi:hypothetical protein